MTQWDLRRARLELRRRSSWRDKPHTTATFCALSCDYNMRINIKMDVRPMMSELELMWRCLQCGHLWPNHSDTLPENCTHCGAPKTEFELVRED